MAGIDPGTFNARARIERPVASSSFTGAGSGTWEEVATVWAEVQDVLPSRAERVANGINVAARPARVRMRRRRDVTAAMRLLIGRFVKDENDQLVWRTDRVTQIVAGPADYLDDAMELMVEEYSSAGNAA